MSRFRLSFLEKVNKDWSVSVRLRFTFGMQRIAPPLGYLQLLALLVCAGCGWMARNDNADGVVLYQQGNYQGAVSHFQQALVQHPGSPDCFYNLGATYHQQAKLFGRPSDLQTADQFTESLKRQGGLFRQWSRKSFYKKLLAAKGSSR